MHSPTVRPKRNKTVRLKRSKKELREAGRKKQKAFVARMKSQGKTLWKMWATAEEGAVLDGLKKILPDLVKKAKDEKTG